MKVIHVQGLFSPDHGGPTRSLENYCISLQKRGHENTAYVLDGWPDISRACAMPFPIKTVVGNVDKPYKLGVSSQLKKSLRSADDPAVFHLHGTWLRAIHYGADEARRRKIPYVFEPMGMYEKYQLAQKWLKKRIARVWFQDRDIAMADCIHVNARNEGVELRQMGFKSPIALIPVGVDTDQISKRLSNTSINGENVDLATRPFFLFLSRIHPKKGIDLLLKAWAKLANRFPDTTLAIAGAGDPAYVAKLKAFAVSCQIADRCVWTGSVSEEEKSWLLSHARLMILPTHSENFGNVVPESLAHGTPVLTTTGTPWRGLVDEKCGWCVAPDATEIERTLNSALSFSDAELKSMGQLGKIWCENNFSLNYTADSIDSVYRWLVEGASKPSCLLD